MASATKKPVAKKPSAKKSTAKKPASNFLKTPRKVACYRYPNNSSAKTRGKFRAVGDTTPGAPKRKPRPKSTHLRCRRKLKTPTSKPTSNYNDWDSATARPSIGTKRRPKAAPVLTTKRGARRGQY